MEEKQKNEAYLIANMRKEQNSKGITLVALVVTIIFSYDEKIKCSNNKGFLLQTV